MEPDYKFSKSGQYHVPQIKVLQNVRDYIENLPNKEDPEVFGMHPNANITY
jgi:dynein heavy chain